MEKKDSKKTKKANSKKLAPETKTAKKFLSIDTGFAAYLLSIISIVQAIFSPISGIVFSIISLSFAIKGKDQLHLKSKKMAIIALVISVLMIVLMLVMTGFATQVGQI